MLQGIVLHCYGIYNVIPSLKSRQFQFIFIKEICQTFAVKIQLKNRIYDAKVIILDFANGTSQ